jgi:hypothetical protein
MERHATLLCVREKKMFSHLTVVSCSENDRAFDILYCITFKLMDQKWLEMHASYMDFNVRLSFLICNLSDTFFVPSTFLADQIAELTLQTVIKSTRRQLERELLLEDIQRIEDMPSYRFLTC